MKRPELTRFQQMLHYSSLYLFEEFLVHKIFDSAIFDMTGIILKEIIYHEPEESDGKIFYTGWNYDNLNQTATKTNKQALYHPIYIQFENVKCGARGWVDIREIDGKTKEELRHDPIIVHINRYLVKKSDFVYQHFEYMYDINGTVPGLLAHELTHVRDMWPTEYENIALTLSNMGHSAFFNDLIDTAKANNRSWRTYMSQHEANLMCLMLGMMSIYESDARLEAIDKAMSVISADTIAEMISKYSDEDDKAMECISQFDYIFGTGIKMLKLCDKLLQKIPRIFTKQEIRFQFEFLCFMVHYEFIQDPEDIITGAESMELLFDENFTLDEHIKDLIIKSSITYSNRLQKYFGDIKDVIRNSLKRRRKESAIEFKLYESIPVEKTNLKCNYYPEDITNALYESLYKKEFENERPAIKIAYELSEMFCEYNIFRGPKIVKRAINEGLKEKPKIWVIDTAHFPV